MPLLWQHVDDALRSKTSIRTITREGYVRTYKRHIHESFGATPVDQITALVVGRLGRSCCALMKRLTILASNPM